EPFISVNCSAIVDTLLESELFGHEKGAFTGAIAQKDGKFTLAKNGTIFLDEIGEMDFNLQAKILRVLQEREFERIGGKDKLKSECRIISATNKDLKELIKEGRFREDLYFRLNVISIHIPPLRTRREDIPDLALSFIVKANLETGRNIKFVSEGALRFLSELPWKGNVRQLENFITQTVIMTRGDRLTEKAVASMMSREDMGMEDASDEELHISSHHINDYHPRTLNEVEKEQIAKALAHTKWHKGRACDILGITRPRLDRKIKKYSIKPLQYYLVDQ
ncbi:MAG TPA: sigma-54-dependent Fis family transcriptional regulator, partial [Nitrospirae bacterium]|nr:sigma-54-dependent Fis family transcriptional regulator [Nitrospirota bacterium]